ncbi:uncharacterized protein LOC116415826 [Nasonia vitripennis]|uniref:Uncharacterized protein n=1 Tax=Nasonia vitripennis TaxID=7425 RepID=A0A7M7PWM3_NASVI|nr:uncharacterized protein LOC116415826 [Nasonia vitripennis]
MKKEDIDRIMENYACVAELDGPKLNPQIMASRKEYALTRDNHMSEVQKMAGTALSIIGSVITSFYKDSESDLEFNLETLLTLLYDSGKILSAIVHKQNITRKAFIEPGLSKETKAVLKDSKTDEFLYGKDLPEKIKEAKALNKVGDELKLSQPNNLGTSTNKSSNYRAPFVRRPPAGQMGSTAFTGRLKQRPFFRNKQQFVNHRAQWHSQSRPFNNQGKKN